MISLFSINKFVNIKCDTTIQNQWYNVNKSNKNDKIVSQFLELERSIVFRQGLHDKYHISFMISDLESHFSRKIRVNQCGNRMDSKYTLLIPIQIHTPDKYMLNTILNNTNNCLIIESHENYCIGTNLSKISKRVIKNDQNNCYLFIHFTNEPFMNSLAMDDVKGIIEINQSVSTSLINKSKIDILTITDDIDNFSTYIENYVTKKPYSFLNFKNTTRDLNTISFDKSQYVNNYFFQDERINNYFQGTNLYVFKTNTSIQEDDFEKQNIIVNKINPNQMDKYLIKIVEKYIEVCNVQIHTEYCISVTISNIKPPGSMIMIPLSKTKEKLLYFCRKEVFTDKNDKKYENINHIYTLQQSNKHVYFLQDNFVIKNENSNEKYCFINLNEPSYSDSDLYMNNKVKNYIDTTIVLKQLPIQQFICDINAVSTDNNYEDFVNIVNENFKNNYDENLSSLNDNNVLLLSESWFDQISTNENEKMFDIINFSNVVNVDSFNDNNNDETYKSIFMKFAPYITNYFNLEKLNVIKTVIYKLTDVAHFVPPEDCLYLYIFLQHSSTISIQCNNCTKFNPCYSPGSILIHTFKKEMIMKADSACNILIFTMKLI